MSVAKQTQNDGASGPTSSPPKLSAAVLPVAEDARRRSDEIEQARCLPQDLAEAMARSGMFRALVPGCHNGLEVHPGEFVESLITLGRADGATGWCAMVGSTTGLLAASLPEPWAEQIYAADPDVITCGVTAPLGRAVRDGDDYRVSGRWPFASGSRNASWICGGCFVVDEAGEPLEGMPDVHLMFFPTDAVTLHDNWHVSGLCGSGSGDFEVTDMRVPVGRSVILGGRARIDRALYRFPTLGLLALGVGSVALGIGLRALDELVELAAGKTPTGSRRRLAERAPLQADVGRADAALESARAWMHATIDAAWNSAQQGERLSVAQKANLRAAAANATWSAVEAVDRAYHAGGGTAIYANSPLQRCFRDIHVATQHIMVAQPIFELTGRVRLGLPPGGPL